MALGRPIDRARAVAAGVGAAIKIIGVACFVRQIVDDEDFGLGGDVHPPHAIDKDVVFVDKLMRNEVSGTRKRERLEKIAFVVVRIVRARVPAG